MQTAGKAFKGIQREEVLALVKFRELKNKTYQDTQPLQNKDIQKLYERFKWINASFDKELRSFKVLKFSSVEVLKCSGFGVVKKIRL